MHIIEGIEVKYLVQFSTRVHSGDRAKNIDIKLLDF